MIASLAAEKRENMLNEKISGPMEAHRSNDNNSEFRIPGEELFDVPIEK
jgi:hypothetical protein